MKGPDTQRIPDLQYICDSNAIVEEPIICSFLSASVSSRKIYAVSLGEPPIGTMGRRVCTRVHRIFTDLGRGLSIGITVLANSNSGTFYNNGSLHRFRDLGVFGTSRHVHLIQRSFFTVCRYTIPIVNTVGNPTVNANINLSTGYSVLVTSRHTDFRLPRVGIKILKNKTFNTHVTKRFIVHQVFFANRTLSTRRVHRRKTISVIIPRSRLVNATHRVTRNVTSHDNRTIHLTGLKLGLYRPLSRHTNCALRRAFATHLSDCPTTGRTLTSVHRHQSPSFNSLPTSISPVPRPQIA